MRTVTDRGSSRVDLGEPDHRLKACIVVPARDESAELPAALASLAYQHDSRGRAFDPGSYEVILLANNCSDDTAEVARRCASEVASRVAIRVVERSFPAGEAHVGTARKWLMDQACSRLEAAGRPRGMIASTDADTRAAPTWLAATEAAMAAGADAVAGVIGVEPTQLRALGPRVRRAYWQDRVHRRLLLELEALVDPNPLDPPPRHDFHGGASFALTAATYRRVGGLPPLPCLEDVALAEALWAIDARFVHSPSVRVRTSPRPIGRALGGQSQAINGWANGIAGRVPGAEQAEAELASRRRLRRCFHAKAASMSASWQPGPAELAALAELYRVDRGELVAILRQERSFGGWLAAIDRSRARRPEARVGELVPIGRAIEQLRARIRTLRRASRA